MAKAKGHILKNEKRTNLILKIVKITNLKYRVTQKRYTSFTDSSKQALKYIIFFNIQKGQKNAQMAKPFFWQTVQKGQMTTLVFAKVLRKIKRIACNKFHF